MRKFFYILGLLSILGLSGFAQQFKKLKVGLGTGYAFAGGRLSKVLFAIEPSFLISDKLSIGLRAESTIIQRDVNGNTSGANISYINFGSYSLNGQRYFGNMSFRPFIGFGVGYFKLETVTAIVNGRITKEDFKFGFYPRIGFDYRHFNFLVDYNLVPNPSSSIINETLNKSLSVRLGFFIGGGRRDK